MLKAVIFDLDGVIIDSEPLHTGAVLGILKQHGVVISESELWKYIGIASSTMWKEMREAYGLQPSIADLQSKQHALNISMLQTSDSVLIPGVAALLAELQNKRIKMAIASSSTLDYIHAVVAKYRLADFFDVLISGEQVPRGKPRPDIFLKAADLLGVAPTEGVVIEDSDNGLTAAREAGIRAVGFRNPNSGNQTLGFADIIVRRIADIDIDMLRGLVG